MNLERDEWALVLRHLDQALELPVAARAGWLEALPALSPHLKTALQELLNDRRAIETAGFLAAGAEASMLQPGGVLGPWRLLRELGAGGMATVWLAERSDGAHARQVALKLPRLQLGSRVVAERFLRERGILSTLQHVHIAQVLDAGESAGQPWLALEFVDGQPITAFAQARQLELRLRLQLFLPVLQAVQHAHGQLVIHRDIKPANVLVDAFGQVKLLDFGVAKLLEPDGASAETALTQLGGRALTPQYASPEQVAGRPLGVASDVYSLGVLLYELLTGRLPYVLRRDTPVVLEDAIANAQVLPPSEATSDRRLARALRGDLDTIVMKALAAEPAMRYASADALAADIQRHLQSLPILARQAGWAMRLRKLWARQKLALGTGAAVALALCVGAGVALWQAGQARAEAGRAAAVQQFLLDIFKANSARQADPEKARAATARELLDIGTERIGRALADQPEARLTLLDTLGELYHDLGLQPQAAALAREAVTLAQKQHGLASQAHLLQLARLADVLADGAASAERQQVVDTGLALLPQLPDRASEARTLFLIEAATHFQSARLDDAEAYSQRALADARALGQPRLLRRAWEVAGVTAQLRNDNVAAEERLLQAVRVGEEAALSGFELLRARVQLADVQARRLRLDASEATLREALATSLRLNGAAHLDTLQTRLGLGFALFRQGRLDEADAEYQAVRTLLQAAPGLDSFTFPIYAGSHGRVLQALGRSAEAEAVLRQGIGVRDRTRPGTRMAAELREFLVHTLVAAGRLDEAATLLAQAENIRIANGLKPGQRAWSLHAMAAQALARARGDAAGERAALDALVAGSAQDTPDSLGWIDGALLRARFDLEQAAPEAAAARLRTLREVLVRHGLVGKLKLVDGQRLALCDAAARAVGAAVDCR